MRHQEEQQHMALVLRRGLERHQQHMEVLQCLGTALQRLGMVQQDPDMVQQQPSFQPLAE